MRRRVFVAALLSTTLTPVAVLAQKVPARKKIAFLSGANPAAIGPILSGLTEELAELGHVERRDYEMIWQFSEGNSERFPALARDVIALGADVIMLGTPAATRAAMEATRTVPIVMGISADPVGNGFVQSLARPGGNVTGLASLQEETTSKTIELLSLIVPGMKRVGVLYAPGPTPAVVLPTARSVGARLGVEVTPMLAADGSQIEAAFARFGAAKVDSVLSVADGFLMQQRAQITRLAIERRLPTAFAQREYVLAGGLMSYGENLRAFFKRSAVYVDKILKGARPADLPVEQPTHFRLVINMKTAASLGITIPPGVLAFADEVME